MWTDKSGDACACGGVCGISQNFLTVDWVSQPYMSLTCMCVHVRVLGIFDEWLLEKVFSDLDLDVERVERDRRQQHTQSSLATSMRLCFIMSVFKCLQVVNSLPMMLVVISEARGVALGMAISICPPLGWSRLKYLNKCWMGCHETVQCPEDLYIYKMDLTYLLWSPEFSSSATSRFTFAVHCKDQTTW